MAYRVQWKCGAKTHILEKAFEDKAKAKSFAANFLRTHYLDHVQVLAEGFDGRLTPVLIKRCVRQHAKAFFGEWEEV